jgi:hypothetical protein
MGNESGLGRWCYSKQNQHRIGENTRILIHVDQPTKSDLGINIASIALWSPPEILVSTTTHTHPWYTNPKHSVPWKTKSQQGIEREVGAQPKAKRQHSRHCMWSEWNWFPGIISSYSILAEKGHKASPRETNMRSWHSFLTRTEIELALVGEGWGFHTYLTGIKPNHCTSGSCDAWATVRGQSFIREW